MDAYVAFAEVYDIFMGGPELDYDGWAAYLEQIFKKHGASPKLILELACGTGNITERMQKKGYEMIGLDASEDMLAVARTKNDNILYLNQDMREFELYGTVDAIICVCDGMNYLVDDGDLLACLKLAHNYLNPGGLLVFDMNTEYKYKEILAENTFAGVFENAAYIWENLYDADEMINEYAVTFFLKDKSGLYKRREETHYQRAYTNACVTSVLKDANLVPAGIYGDMTLDPPLDRCERVFFVARRE